MLVTFFGASLVFAELRRLTDDSPAGVAAAAQVGALALIVLAVVVFSRRGGGA